MIRSAAVIGLGYVGLPTAAIFAEAGLDIIGVDTNPDAVASINAGRPHIIEPNLEALLRRVVEAGKLRAVMAPEQADVYVIAVPTPFKEGNKPDLKYIEAAAHAIALVLAKGALVILESTSPVGATEQLSEWLAKDRPDLSFPQNAGDLADVQVAHCPERVLPGKVLHEVVHNSRVIGGMTRHCATRAVSFYRHAVQGECHVTDARTAELAKLAENAFRDVNIAFANELSTICHDLDIDPWELIEMSNKHPRVNILNPGPGVGGHCIAVDPWFLVHMAGDRAKLIRTAREVNTSKPHWVVRRTKAVAGRLREPVVACLGATYKPDIDDVRESPAIEIIDALQEAEIGRVMVVEPHLEMPEGYEQVSPEKALEEADIFLFLVGHTAFQKFTQTQLAEKIVLDVCGVMHQPATD